MATYRVKLGSSEGEILFRQARGRNREEVEDHFLKEGFYVFSIRKIFDFTAVLGIRRRIPAKQFILFNKEFRGLVRAGLPIVEGFDILLKRMKPSRLKNMLVQVREQLTKGESLSQAFKTFDDIIPRYYAALLHAGEQSGGLEEVLDRFIEQEQRIRRTRKKFYQTLTYPAILLLVGMVSMYIILSRAMPQFAGLYKSVDRELPLVTRIVIGISDWIAAYYVPTLIGLFAVAVLAHLYLKTQKGSSLGEGLLTRIPVLGPLWQLQNQNIFARTMRLLIGGGIPVPQALAIVAGAVPSRVFGSRLNRVHGQLLQGQSLQDALEKHARLSDMAGELIRVGEHTGTLGEMFEHLAEHGEERSEDYLELISNLIAPLVLLFVGLIIAVLVVAMYLPMFGTYDALGR